MAELSEENRVSGVFGGVEINNGNGNTVENAGVYGNNVQNTGIYGNNAGNTGMYGNNTENAGIYGNNTENTGVYGNYTEAGTIKKTNLPAKISFWSRFKAFWLQEIDWNKEIKVELTPYQQKVEDEINEFLHQEITWEKVHDFLFKEVTFGRKK